jgi:hypothetical protein
MYSVSFLDGKEVKRVLIATIFSAKRTLRTYSTVKEYKWIYLLIEKGRGRGGGIPDS